MLLVLRQTEYEAIVLTAEHDGRGSPVVRLVDLIGAPSSAGTRRNDSRGATLLEAQAEFTGPTREAVAGTTNIRAARAAPLPLHGVAQALHAGQRCTRRILRPIIARAARRLRGRYEDELASCARQPFHEGGAVGETRQNDRCRGEVASAGARTVGEHRAFERPDAWRHEVDMRVPPAPAPPRAIALVACGDPESPVRSDKPVLPAPQACSPGETWADGIE